MKTLKITTSILINALFFLNSCAVLDKYEISTSNIDLTAFEQQGLFVTTGDLFIATFKLKMQLFD